MAGQCSAPGRGHRTGYEPSVLKAPHRRSETDTSRTRPGRGPRWTTLTTGRVAPGRRIAVPTSPGAGHRSRCPRHRRSSHRGKFERPRTLTSGSVGPKTQTAEQEPSSRPSFPQAGQKVTTAISAAPPRLSPGLGHESTASRKWASTGGLAEGRLPPAGPIDGRRYSQWPPNESVTKYPNIANIAFYQHFCERTTGFEPATLTLAKWGTVLVLKSLSH